VSGPTPTVLLPIVDDLSGWTLKLCDNLRFKVAGCSRKYYTSVPVCDAGLVDDDEIMLRACGQDDATLREVVWDVSQWKGIRARRCVVRDGV